jgi:CTP synthase
MTKFIVVSGGVISGIGKGVSAASIGLLLKLRGEHVQIIKFDPYLNVSASLLSPYQHGEVFLCDDGGETDLDLGTYERITGIPVSSRNICTSGKIFQELVDDEVHGKYMGQTVQFMPHLTNKIQEKMIELGGCADIVIVEIGGTVGDMESNQFFEAVSQLRLRLGSDNVMIVHVAPILWINTIKEFKTKPLQNSVRDLKRFGLAPDILLCRVDRSLPDKKLLDKCAELTGIPREAIFDAPDAQSIYEVPLHFYDRHVDDLIADRFHLRRNGVRIHKWRELVDKYINSDVPDINIGIVGKYASMEDAYLSLKEAIMHAGVTHNCKVHIEWIEAEKLEEYQSLRGLNKYFENIHGVIVPGGFDKRGVEGKIKAVQYVREKSIPFLGICLGLQCAVIEFARHECNISQANSEEFAPQQDTDTWVVHYIPGQENITKKGGTLRLGAYECNVVKGSIAHQAYKKRSVNERHRHRYEVNGKFIEQFEKKGFKVTGSNPGTNLVEIMELDRNIHPFFLGCQFHPEFKSRLDSPHPLFEELISSAIHYRNGLVVDPEKSEANES